ncbi:MAG: JAB domain-containing protein [Bacteroidetes bacterium QS_8_68_28]|jgi:DNA repair protein RadC|nr:MAG: JAB domain-containing protein [Bacteroidetes bacterium QS_8_68_28]
MPDERDAPAEETTDAEEPPIAYHAPITEWDAEDRPREKLAKHGSQVLSDAELLALIIGSGTRTAEGPVSAVGLGKALGRAFGSLSELARREEGTLTRVRGVGPAKAAKLLAAFEIGRRVEAEHAAEGADERIQVQSPEDVAAAYGPQMRGLKQEVFKIVLLNTANVVEGDYTVSEGGLAASIVEPRAVFQTAVLENAAAVICLHNHPSGNPEPSREDEKITRQLAEAGEVMGIPVHDHLIIAGSGYTSLAERGVL